MMLKCIKQHLSISEVQFIRKLRNAEAELNKTVPYKKKRVLYWIRFFPVSIVNLNYKIL